MTFCTPTFLIFLCVVFAGYWSLPKQPQRNVLLVFASYFFYGWWDYRFCGLMLTACVLDYLVGRGLERAERPAWRRMLLLSSCTWNLGVLFAFKYFNFFASNLEACFHSLGWSTNVVLLQVVLPVGISFYTFQTLGYVFDVYRKEVPACRRLMDYLAFIAFFPQLVAGPIERAAQILPQFLQLRTFSYPQAVDGCRQILLGFVKKVAIADNLAIAVEECYRSPSDFDGPRLAFATVCFAFQIYCDFSAYSDMAAGTARLFGIELMRNFASPYLSRSPTEFWRRWHISLSTWFRDNVYFPLGGSRSGVVRMAWALLATFVVSGLWHGAAWTYLAWGALNGLGVLAMFLYSRRWKSQAFTRLVAADAGGLLPQPAALAQMLLTFAFVCLTWIFFRAGSMDDAWLIVQKISGLAGSTGSRSLTGYRPEIALTLAGILLVAEWVQRHHPHPLVLDGWPRSVRWLAYTGLIWSAILLRPAVPTGQFIYFQF